jgi:hypothetical protein
MEYLRIYNEPPNLTQVWIGRGERRNDHLLALHTNDVLIESGEWIGALHLVVIGGLVLAVFTTERVVDGAWQGIGLDPSSFEQVWPHEAEEVLWPPATILTPEMLRQAFPVAEPLVLS